MHNTCTHMHFILNVYKKKVVIRSVHTHNIQVTTQQIEDERHRHNDPCEVYAIPFSHSYSHTSF